MFSAIKITLTPITYIYLYISLSNITYAKSNKMKLGINATKKSNEKFILDNNVVNSFLQVTHILSISLVIYLREGVRGELSQLCVGNTVLICSFVRKTFHKQEILNLQFWSSLFNLSPKKIDIEKIHTPIQSFYASNFLCPTGAHPLWQLKAYSLLITRQASQ